MMILRLFLAISIALLVTTQPTAAGEDTWTRAYGDIEHDSLHSVAAMPDGGVIAVGSLGTASQSSSSSTLASWVLRTDAEGAILWQRRWGSSGWNNFEAVELLDDGSVVLSGAIDNKAVLVRVDAEGEVIWRRSLTPGLYAVALASLPGGGFVAAGAQSLGEKGTDAWIARFDDEGRQIWSRTVDNAAEDYFRGLVILPNGTFIAAGRTGSHPAGFAASLAANYDAAGRLLWVQEFPSEGDGFTVALALPDGDIALLGSAVVGRRNQDGWMVLTEADGTVIKSETFGSIAIETVEDAVLTSEGTIIVAGQIMDLGSLSSIGWIAEIDLSPEILWERRFATVSGSERLWGVTRSPDGHIFTVGEGNTPRANTISVDGWIARLGIGGIGAEGKFTAE